MDGPRDCHTVKSEREKRVSCIKGYMWNPEKWYKPICRAGRETETYRERGRQRKNRIVLEIT